MFIQNKNYDNAVSRKVLDKLGLVKCITVKICYLLGAQLTQTPVAKKHYLCCFSDHTVLHRNSLEGLQCLMGLGGMW